MDSSDSDIPDLLQFLQYPTRTVSKLPNRFHENLVARSGNSRLYIKEDQRWKGCQDRGTQIFNNTIQRSSQHSIHHGKVTLIHEDHSFLSITGLIPPNSEKYTRRKCQKANEQQLINVSVVSQTCNIHKRRKHSIKVYKTTSNQGNSTKQTRKLFLFITGIDGDKIYEVKSAEGLNRPKEVQNFLSSKRAQYDPRKESEVVSLNKLLCSMNMEKKCFRKNEKRKRKKDPKQIKERCPGINDDDDKGRGVQNEDEDALPTKSQVKIYGRLGLTHDDKYVLSCAATVDNKPVETRIFNRSTSPASLHERQDEDCIIKASNKNRFAGNQSHLDECEQPFANLRHSFTQTRSLDLTNRPASENNAISVKKESQGTQADFNICLSNGLGSWNIRSGCDCNRLLRRPQQIEDSPDETITHGRSNKEPLVVITVYPRNSMMDETKANVNIYCKKDNINLKDVNSPAVVRASRYSAPIKVENKNENIKYVTKNKEEKINTFRRNINNNVTRKSDRDASPMEQHGKLMKIKNSEKPKDSNNRLYRKEAVITNNVTTDHQAIKMNIVTNRKINKKDDKKERPSSPNAIRKASKKCTSTSTNTETVDAKTETKGKITRENIERPRSALRTLLDNVWYRPKEAESNIAIDIDAENEFYNILFRQGSNTTNLKVKKRIKHAKVGTGREKESVSNIQIKHNSSSDIDSASLANFLLEPTNERKRSFSQTLLDEQAQLEPRSKVNSQISLQHAKDSLEISHRRDDRRSNKSSSGSLHERNKHYKGDACTITDPSERDKEVRHLLGIDVIRSRHVQNHGREMRENISEMPIRRLNRSPIINERTTDKTLHCGECIRIKRKPEINRSPIVSKTAATQYDISTFEEMSLYKELMLNYRTNVYENVNKTLYYVEITKKKPIALTKAQYDKVKRTIHYRNVKTTRVNKPFKSSYRTSSSVLNQESMKKMSVKNLEISTQTNDIKVPILKQAVCDVNKIPTISNIYKKSQADLSKVHEISKGEFAKNVVAMAPDFDNFLFFKQTKVNNAILPSYYCGSNSIHTLYKGRRRCVTPNLGASLDSVVDSQDINVRYKCHEKSLNGLLKAESAAKKKPFLRRLMSCLVMRTKTPNLNLNRSEINNKSIVLSDTTYHISTTMAPIEMSSSIYDASHSLFSNHTESPINYKMKKGFLCSVKGLFKKK